MGDIDYQNAWDRLTLTSDMLCDKSFSPYLCRNCDYYYREDHIAYCLKRNVHNWALYRISHRRGK